MSQHRSLSPESRTSGFFPSYSGVFITILLLTTGCDVLDVAPGGDSIFLSTSRVICFEFTGVTDGGSKTILSSDVLDLDDFLRDQGFSKSEILSAEVNGISLRLLFPGSENLSVFDRAVISLRAGSITRTVASSADLGSGRSVSLTPSGANVGSVLQAASFQGVLEITGAASVPAEFLVEVELDFSLEMEGV